MTNPSQNELESALQEVRNLAAKAESAKGMTAEEKQKVEKLEAVLYENQTKSDELVRQLAEKNAKMAELEAKANELEVSLSRISSKTEQKDVVETTKLEMKAIETALLNAKVQNVRPALTEEQKGYLRTDDDAAGGYLVPELMDTNLIKNITEISNIRALATVRTIGAKTMSYPKRTGLVTAYWVGEGETVTASQSTYGKGSITPQKMMIEVEATLEMIQDSAFSVEQLIREDGAEAFNQLEGAAFVEGNDTDRPRGFMASSEVGEIVTGSATTINTNSIMKLASEVKTAYKNGSVYGMNRKTMFEVQKLRTGDGVAEWQNGNVAAGIPTTFNGYPVVEIPDMDDVAADAYPIVFGNFREAYTIVDRLGFFALPIDYYSAGSSGKVKFRFLRRVGGDVVKGEALKKLKVSL